MCNRKNHRIELVSAGFAIAEHVHILVMPDTA
jgi:hypothetical protein